MDDAVLPKDNILDLRGFKRIKTIIEQGKIHIEVDAEFFRPLFKKIIWNWIESDYPNYLDAGDLLVSLIECLKNPDGK